MTDRDFDVADSPPIRSRPRVLWLAMGLAVAVVAAVTVTAVVLAQKSPSPALSATSTGGLVVAEGQHFPSSKAVEVSAASPDGTGGTTVVTDDRGGFRLGFRLPAGVTGRVEVSAQSGDSSRTATARVHSLPAADKGRAPAVVVPMTGAPAAPPRVSADPSFPRRDVPTSIAADCSSDVTAPLNAWLASVPDRSTVVFPEGGCYVVNGSLTLSKRNDLVIDGQGATFKARTPVRNHSSERAQWRLDYGTRITLENMTVLGLNPAPTFQESMEFDHNIFIRGSHTVTVQNVHGGHAYGDFISIAQGADETTVPGDITIRDVSATTIGRNAISCVACDGVNVSGSVFDDVALHVFDLEIEGDGRPGRNVTFTDNTAERHGWAAFSVGTPFQTHRNDLSNITITDNTVTAPGSSAEDCIPAISFLYSKIPARNVRIENNRLVSQTDAIMVTRATGVTIQGNTAVLVQPSCGHPVGVRTTAVSGARVGNNVMTGYTTPYAAN